MIKSKLRYEVIPKMVYRLFGSDMQYYAVKDNQENLLVGTIRKLRKDAEIDADNLNIPSTKERRTE